MLDHVEMEWVLNYLFIVLVEGLLYSLLLRVVNEFVMAKVQSNKGGCFLVLLRYMDPKLIIDCVFHKERKHWMWLHLPRCLPWFKWENKRRIEDWRKGNRMVEAPFNFQIRPNIAT